MSDRYAQLVNAPVASTLAKQLGLPQPVELERYRPGAPVISGQVLSGSAPEGRLIKHARAVLDQIGVERGSAEGRVKGLVFDASGISDSTELVELQRFFYPAIGRLARCGRVVVLGTEPSAAGSTRARTAQRALEGFTRSLAKEIGGRGSTAQLVLVSPGGEEQLASTLRFLLSPRSAYVSGTGGPGRPGGHRRPRDRLGAAARRQAGAGHRRLARDRRRDRRDPRPRRRPRHRPRHPARRRGSPQADRRARRGGDRPRHHRRGRAGADRRRRRRGHRRPRPQRRRHPRPDDREDAGGALDEIDGDQSLQRGADQRHPARPRPAPTQRPHRLRLLDVGDRRQLGPDQLRDLEGGRDRDGRIDGSRARRARGDDQRGRPRLHRDEDDRGDAVRPARSRAPAQQPLAGRPAGRRRRDDRLVREPGARPGSTATRSASAARTCWGPRR